MGGGKRKDIVALALGVLSWLPEPTEDGFGAEASGKGLVFLES